MPINSHSFGIYARAPKFHAEKDHPTKGYPYCKFCCEKYRIKAEIAQMTSVIDGAGRLSLIPNAYLAKANALSSKNSREQTTSYYTTSKSINNLTRARFKSCYGSNGIKRGCGKTIETQVSSRYVYPLTAEEVKDKLDLRQRLMIEGNPAYMKRQLIANVSVKRYK